MPVKLPVGRAGRFVRGRPLGYDPSRRWRTGWPAVGTERA